MSDQGRAPFLNEDLQLRFAVEAFYRREIRVLQERRYQDWLALMDEAVTYRVPVTVHTEAGLVVEDNALGYYDEDMTLLKARVQKLESRRSWVENPPSRLRYFLQVLDIETGEGDELMVSSNLLLFQHRWNLDQHFSGERRDVLLPHADGFRVKGRTVILDRQGFTAQGLSVFF